MERMCPTCRKVKDEKDFRLKRLKRNGKVYTAYGQCLECEKVYNHTYYLNHTKQKRKEARTNGMSKM